MSKKDTQYGYENEADMLRYIAEEQYPKINHFDYGVDMWDLPSISRDIDGAVEFGYLDENETLWEVIESGVSSFVDSAYYELFVGEFYEFYGKRIYTNSALFKYLADNYQVFDDEVHIDEAILQQIQDQQPKFSYRDNVLVGWMIHHIDYWGGFCFTRQKRLTPYKLKMVLGRLSDYYGATVSWDGHKFLIQGIGNYLNVFETIDHILWSLGFNDIKIKRINDNAVTAEVDIISY